METGEFLQKENKETEEWVIKINEEVRYMENLRKRSIYRVPARVADLNKKAYKPQAVSFGPYHHGEEHLKPMEEHKHRALLHFLRRSNKPLEIYVEALKHVVQELKDSYDLLDPVWQTSTEAFLQLMILDGCFMLEILRVAAGIPNDYDEIDPVFSKHGKLHAMPYLRRDMLMLENQLPMLVLDMLLVVENQNRDEEFINKLIVKFFHWGQRPRGMGKCLHLLDGYRKCLLVGDPDEQLHVDRRVRFLGESQIIPSATELSDAGIQFKMSRSGSLKDVTFRGVVLRLPTIIVDNDTQPIFLNLMAFERHHVGAGNDVTSYVFFMDNIIENAMDVNTLYANGIIINALGREKDVELFSTLSNDVTLDPENNLSYVSRRLSSYCNTPWNKWRATLVRSYFRNPWAIVSVFAAKLLFVLTIVQTVFTILPLYHRPS